MPVFVKLIRGKYRLTHKDGSLVRNKAGTPLSRGTSSKPAARKQAIAINLKLGYYK